MEEKVYPPDFEKLLSTPKGSLITFDKMKLPPQAVDLEEAILGAMMIDKRGVDEVIDLLNPDVFYKPAHKYIYESILKLFNDSEPIDLLTVSSQLRKNKTLEHSGGEFYLVQITKKIVSSAHIEFHARVVLQKYIQRRLIKLSNEIIESAYDESTDVFELLDTAESKLYEVAQGNLKKSTETAESLVIQAKKKLEELSKKEGISGVPTGFKDLDRATSGWQASDLIIVAARPGMGKTAMCLTMARNISVERNTPVAFFSLEMSSVQCITRLISSETGIPSDKLRSGKLEEYEWTQLNTKITKLEKAPLFIDDTPSLSIFDLRAKARRLSSQHGIKLIIVDYLQLMTTGVSQKGGGNREQEISAISRSLKALAKELDIPIIALSQLSRAVETRSGSKRPQLSDLRESGAIEQDADIVSFIYRPEYYGITEWDDQERTPTEGQAELIIAKHRNGGLRDIRLRFIGDLGKFEDFGVDSYVFESKMNSSASDGVDTKNLPNSKDVFGEDTYSTSDVPF